MGKWGVARGHGRTENEGGAQEQAIGKGEGVVPSVVLPDPDLRGPPGLPFTDRLHRQSGRKERHELGFDDLEIVSENSDQDVDDLGQIGTDDTDVPSSKQRLHLGRAWLAEEGTDERRGIEEDHVRYLRCSALCSSWRVRPRASAADPFLAGNAPTTAATGSLGMG